MEVNRERNGDTSSFKTTCTKYALFLLNIVIIIATVTAITYGISTVAAYSSYYNLMRFGLDTLKTLWTFVGIIILFVALFGILATFRESAALANIYGITMMAVFLLQISVSIYSFTLTNITEDLASTLLASMMFYYTLEYRQEVDWIQSNFRCCGEKGPSDWQNYDRFSTPNPYYGQWNYNQWNYQSVVDAQLNATDLMPVSCCSQYSNYVDLKCEHYHDNGCAEPLQQIVYASIMLVVTTGLIFSALQILGTILGLAYARMLRSKKTQRDIEIWNSGLYNGEADSTSC